MKRLWKPLALLALAFAGFVFLNNTTLLAPKPEGRPILLAHRGVAQRFDHTNLTNDTCTAARMLPPTHGYLENTIPSMRAAFEAGADIVEFEVHPTTDGQFAVFHDWTLDCRTDGTGVTRAHSMAELKTLDIGYGYTADGGKTFPFRGKGVGLMPSLDEVLAAFPESRFLITIKSNDSAEGDKLAAALSRLPPERRGLLMVHGGGDRPIAEVARKLPDVKTASRATLKPCLIGYIALGWTGYVPSACHNRLITVPINIAPWLWGWPERFLTRMRKAGTEVFAAGLYHGGSVSGIDTKEELDRLPADYDGGIWTDEIEVIGPTIGRLTVQR